MKQIVLAALAAVAIEGRGIFAAQPPEPMPYTVPFEKQVRVILSMDTANEVDDALAIIHALLTPQFDVKGIVAAHFRTKLPDPLGLSVAETERLLEKGGFEIMRGRGIPAAQNESATRMSRPHTRPHIPLLRGAAEPMLDDATPRDSEGARFIIAEALKDDHRPLFVCCGGPLTDVASAILIEPSITNRLTVTWSGGGAYPNGGGEYNWSSDPQSVNTVFSSFAPVWQFPNNVYSQMRVTTARLALNMRPRGAVGRHMFDAMMAFNEKMKKTRGWPRGEDWTDGDAPFIGALLDQGQSTNFYEMRPAPRVDPTSGRYSLAPNRPIRIYTKIDGETIIEDFFAKLALAYPKKGNENE